MLFIPDILIISYPISEQSQFRYSGRFNDIIKQCLFDMSNTIDWSYVDQVCP